LNNGEHTVNRKYRTDNRTAEIGFLSEPDSQQANTGRPGKEVEK
jgi:hypothetical protein